MLNRANSPCSITTAIRRRVPALQMGIAIATYASVGQRTLTIAPEKSPPGTAAVIIIRPRQGGAGFKYTIPMTALAQLGPMNKNLDPRERYDAVMAAEGLFQVEPVQ